VATLTICIAITANRTDIAQARGPEYTISVIADGISKTLHTSSDTVSTALSEAGIDVGPTDIVEPKVDTPVSEGLEIRVVRVSEQVILQKEPIAFSTKRQPTTELRMGLNHVVSEGEPGLKHLYYKVRYEDGVLKQRDMIRAEVVVEPKDRVVKIGDRGMGVSRGMFTSRRMMRMVATAYDPGPRSCGKYATGRTCIGMKAGYGVVAVDPRVIPFRTKLYIEGYGYAIAGDSGRAIKGNRIDLGFNTYSTAKRFGRRSVKVYILES
jgi:3D (Asp-Asp-Asp) domain-containing protein